MDSIKIFAFADEANPTIDEQIVAMKRNGLQGLEIRGVDGQNISNISLEKAKEVKEKMDKAGLTIWSIGSPIGKIDIEKDSFTEHLEKLKHTLEIANVLNAENIRLFSFYIQNGKNPDDYESEVIDRLGIISELSVKSGIIPCHENEKGIYGDNAERCLKIYEKLPLIKGVFDPANFVQCNVDTLSAWKMLKPYIKYLHIKDALADGSVVPAGEGIGNIRDILKDYISLGGNAVTIEPHLTVFSGLSSLEREGEESIIGKKFNYPDAQTAFEVACNSLKSLI